MSETELTKDQGEMASWLAQNAWGRDNAKQVNEIAQGLGWIDYYGGDYTRRIRAIKLRLVNKGLMIGNISEGSPRGYFVCDPFDEEDLKIARQSIEDQIRPQLEKLIVFTPEAGEVLRIVENMINQINTGETQ